MAVSRVTRDNPVQDSSRLRAFVGNYDAMRCSDSIYAIANGQGVEALYEALRPSMAQDDVAYVACLCEPWTGVGYAAMSDWLRRHL